MTADWGKEIEHHGFPTKLILGVWSSFVQFGIFTARSVLIRSISIYLVDIFVAAVYGGGQGFPSVSHVLRCFRVYGFFAA